ncbi:MAG: hypothetical protein KGJ34_01655 [Patescibacteria group bacterium]|nr:hypothetical protein [Patescibacteria group bacterium]
MPPSSSTFPQQATPSSSISKRALRAARFSHAAFFLFVAGMVLSLLAIGPTASIPTPLVKFALGALLLALSIICLFVARAMGQQSPAGLGRGGVFIVFLLPIVYLISFLAAVDRSVGLLGTGNEVDSLLFVMFVALSLFLSFLFARSIRRARTILMALLTSALIAGAFQYLVIFGGMGFLSSVFTDDTINLIGKWNDLGLLSALAALIIMVRSEFSPLAFRGKILSGIALVLILFLLLVINFSTAWWMLLGGAVLIAGAKYFLSRKIGGTQTHRGFSAWWAGIIVLISIAFLIFGGMLNAHLPGPFSVPSLEVRPALSSTYDIAGQAHGGSAVRTLIGNGPNTFGEAWLQYKPAGVNETQFWSVDFITGFSVLMTALVSVGLIGALMWLIPLLLSILGLLRLWKLMPELSSAQRTLIFSLGIASLFMSVALLVYALSQDMVLLAFIVTGAFLGSLGSLRSDGSVAPLLGRMRIVVLLGMLLLAVLFSFTAFASVRRLLASSYENLSALALSNNNVVDAASYGAQSQSIELMGSNLRLGVEIDLAAMRQLASASTSPAQAATARTQFQALLTQAISQGQAAALMNPLDYQPYLELSNVYAFLTPLNVQGAYQSEVTAYEEAMKLDPTNPAIPLLLARAEASENLSSNSSQVQDLIKQSLTLKPDYTDAFLLAEQVAVAQNDVQTAIAAAKSAILSDQGDTAENLGPLWFQLGLFYYVENDMTDAVTAFQNSLSLIPNYANAQYFLGLAYYSVKQTQNAIAEFEQLSQTNSGNTEVALILANLEAGKNPFAGETQKPVNPAQRAQAPIGQ